MSRPPLICSTIPTKMPIIIQAPHPQAEENSEELSSFAVTTL
jgi:hypothetical protein